MTTQWQSATEKETASVLLQGPRRANYYSAHVPCPGNPPGCRKKVTHFSPCVCRVMWSTTTQLVSPRKVVFDILLPVHHLLPRLKFECGTVWMLHKILCNITTRFMCSAASKSFVWTFHRQRNGCRENVGHICLTGLFFKIEHWSHIEPIFNRRLHWSSFFLGCICYDLFIFIRKSLQKRTYSSLLQSFSFQLKVMVSYAFHTSARGLRRGGCEAGGTSTGLGGVVTDVMNYILFLLVIVNFFVLFGTVKRSSEQQRRLHLRATTENEKR